MSTPPPFAAWVSAQAQRVFEAEVRARARPLDDLLRARAYHDAENRRRLQSMQALFPTEVVRQDLAGVPVDVVTRAGAHASLAGDGPVLICLHGGGFAWGAGPGALLEAIPVAAVSGFPVVAVDYRLAPESRHPAAVEDAIRVYLCLLKARASNRLGLYGCSAGGVLVAQTLAGLQLGGHPRPGAAAMLHAAGVDIGGDLAALSPSLTDDPPQASVGSLLDLAYFDGADRADPIVFPGEHRAIVAGFPPSLLVAATRDFASSAVSVMHRRLLAAGVPADLLLFDGMWHAFHIHGELAESRELYDRLCDFFARWLGDAEAGDVPR